MNSGLDSLLQFIQQHWVSFIIAVVGLVGSIASITSWIQGVRTKRKYDTLFKYVDLNVDKTVTEEQISQKRKQVSTIDSQIKSLKQQIAVDIPREARKAVLLDRLHSITEDLTRNHAEIIATKKKLLVLGHGSTLGDDILRVVRHEVQPKYLIRERLSQNRTMLAAVTAASAVCSTILPYPIGRMLGAALLITAIPSIITILRYSLLQRSSTRQAKAEALPKKPDTSDLLSVLKSLPQPKAHERIDAVIANSVHELIDSDVVISEMATTNATDWSVDEYEIKSWEADDHYVRVVLSFHCSGEQDTDSMYSGDEISGTATAVIAADGTVSFEEVTAEKESYEG